MANDNEPSTPSLLAQTIAIALNSILLKNAARSIFEHSSAIHLTFEAVVSALAMFFHTSF